MNPPDYPSWMNDPITVNPEDYLQQMTAADSRPGDAIKRARSNLGYARKKRWINPADPPFPNNHVWADSFFRWLLRKYPAIEGIDPHYARQDLIGGASTSWSDSKPPSNPTDPFTALQQENATLKARIASLEMKLEAVKAENQEWRRKDAARRAINSENAKRPRNYRGQKKN